MKIQLIGKTLELPDVLYLDQLVKIDLSKLNQFINVDVNNNDGLNDVLIWFLNFFKAIGVEERLSLPDFIQLKESGKLEEWMQKITSGFRNKALVKQTT